jgi:tol-pal system protein YbgF
MTCRQGLLPVGMKNHSEYMPMKFKLLIAGIALLGLSGCAIQQDIAILENRIMALERQNQELYRQNSNLKKQFSTDLEDIGQTNISAEKKIRSQYASMNVTMDTIQQDLRLLTGRIEEVEYLLNRKYGDYEATEQKQQARMDELGLSLAKMDQRLAQIELYLNLDEKSKTGRTSGAGSGAGQVPSVEKLYKDAKGLFDQGQMDKARSLFEQLLKKYPESENADNAQFWIAETYYKEQWFEKAILEYQVVVEKYPKGNKVPAAMYKQGLAFLKIGDQANARLILKELVKKYPQSNEARIATEKLNEI